MGRNKDRIMAVLSEEGKEKLIKRLGARGFIVSPQGHVDVENPRQKHTIGVGGHPLPVAYIGKADYYIELVNIDERTLRKYPAKIQKLL